MGDKAGEGRSYANLGCAHFGLGQFKTAIDYHQRDLKIAKEVGDKAGEGRGHGNLGRASDSVGQFKTAVDYHQRHLEIAKEVGTKAEEGGSYANLGCAYFGLGQFKSAIDYHQSGLEIAKEVGDKTGEAFSLCSLGKNFECEGNLKRAFDCFHSCVEAYDRIRAGLRFNDQWKIWYRYQHKSAYTGLWRLNLIQNEFVNVLLAAKKRTCSSSKISTGHKISAPRFFKEQRPVPYPEFCSNRYSFHSYQWTVRLLLGFLWRR